MDGAFGSRSLCGLFALDISDVWFPGYRHCRVLIIDRQYMFVAAALHSGGERIVMTLYNLYYYVLHIVHTWEKKNKKKLSSSRADIEWASICRDKTGQRTDKQCSGCMFVLLEGQDIYGIGLDWMVYIVLQGQFSLQQQSTQPICIIINYIVQKTHNMLYRISS